jgi:glucuronyl esterase-like protein
MIVRALFGCLIGLASGACSDNESPPAASGDHAGEASVGVAGAGLSPAVGGAAAGNASAAGATVGGAAAGNASSGAAASGAGTGGTAGGSSMAGVGGRKSDPIPVKDLPTIKEMPDPLTMNDGTMVTTPEQWKVRRQELIQILEDYEYGHMPPPPGNVEAATATASKRISASGGLEADYRMLHLSFGPDKKLGFDLGIFTPVATQAGQKFPTLIFLTSSANDKSLADASAALSRGYAVATVPYQQLGADASNWQKTAFFSAYPDYDWRDFSAWAWGISRAVDYLVTDAAIDPTKLMVTGVSRLGQAALLVGAFDERIALSAPVAGGMAFRFSGKEMGGGLGQGITEIVDQNTYWFGPRLPDFRNQTPRLPSDQHWLPALTAPRFFILCNSLSDQYGRAYAAVQTYQYAKPVYALLGADQAIGLNFRTGSHGMTAEDWSAVLDFADQNLLKKAGTRKFDVIPPADQLP